MQTNVCAFWEGFALTGGAGPDPNLDCCQIRPVLRLDMIFFLLESIVLNKILVSFLSDRFASIDTEHVLGK